jgi:hypothetical protein
MDEGRYFSYAMLVNAKAGVEEAKPQIGISQRALTREFDRIEIDNWELGFPEARVIKLLQGIELPC